MFTRIPVNIKILFGFALAISGIGYFLFTTYKNAQEIQKENATINYHISILSSVDKILFNMQHIENGTRGFVLTNDDKFLEPYYEGLEKSELDLKELDRIIQSDVSKKTVVDSIKLLSKQKIILSENAISLCRHGRQKEAIELISGGEGKIIMNRLLVYTERLEFQSRDELNKTSVRKEFGASQTRRNFLFLSTIIFISLVIFYLVIVSDLRKSERVKNKLNNAGLRIRDLYNNAPCGYLSVDANLRVTQINNTALKWLGYNLQEVEYKKTLNELVDPKYHSVINDIKENNTISNLEIELTNNDKCIDVLLDSVTIKDGEGKPIEKRIVLTDISNRKKTEDENRYFARLIDQTSDAIYSMDKNLKIRSWNKGAEKIYGFTLDEISKSETALVRSNMTNEERQSVISELNAKGNWSGELIHYRKDGTGINVLVSISVIRNENKEIIGYVAVVQDITTRKLYENKLTNFNNELIEKVNIKTKEIVSILERVTDGFLSLDKDYNIVYLNTVAGQMLGTDKSILLGKNLTTAFSKEDNSIRAAYKKAFEKQERVEIEDYYEYLNKWFYGVMYPSPEGVSIYFRDVTKRKQSELKLVESEKQYRYLFEQNPLPMFVLDIDSMTILDVNKATSGLYGYSYSELTGMHFTDLLIVEEKERCIEYCRNRDVNAENAGVWQHETKDGEIIFVEILSYNTKYTEKPSLLLISNNITDKIKYEEELKTSRDQLRQLSIHSEKVREEERAHIAREIHDELGQQLTGLKMDLSWLSKRMDTSMPGAKDKINEMLGLVDDTVKSIRKIASELRPGMLDDLGLNAAIDWQTHEFEKRSGINCIYRSNIKDQVFEKNISIGVFRVLQEALTNVARHSNASMVTCDLLNDNNEIRLIINDNGKGIAMNDKNHKTLGLLGMKERALMMNGNLSIESETGRGTKIQLTVPLKPVLS